MSMCIPGTRERDYNSETLRNGSTDHREAKVKFSMESSREIDKNGDGERVSLRRCSQPRFQDTIRSRVILFVDDDPLIQRSRRIIFEALGYFILTAISCEEALAAMRNNVVDAVVLDYVMP